MCRMEESLAMPEMGDRMATPHPMCSTCLRPLVLGAFSISKHGEMAHLNCQGSLRSANSWPEGIRHLLCLKCGRAFESDSKAQRLCGPCRSGSASRAR